MVKGTHRQGERRMHQALRWAHLVSLIPPRIPGREVLLLSCHRWGNGLREVQVHQVESWVGAHSLPVPSACFSSQTALNQCCHDSSLPWSLTVPGNRLQPPDLLIRWKQWLWKQQLLGPRQWLLSLYWSQVSERRQCKDVTQSLSTIKTSFNGKMFRVIGRDFVSLNSSLCTASGTWCVLSSYLLKDEGRRPGLNDWIVLGQVFPTSPFFGEQKPSLWRPDLKATLKAKKKQRKKERE